MRIIELVIDENDHTSGIEAVSVVQSPAIEENFIALQKHELELKKIDEEKRILMGAALIPNKQIYRLNEKTKEEYYIYFSEKTVKKASELFLMRSNQNNATYEHKDKLEGLSVVESWIIEDEKLDKSKKYGFDLPVGTWMISMKVNNDEVWGDVKEGKVKGFSIEGYFADKYEMSLNINKKEEMETLEKLKELILEYENQTKLSKYKVNMANLQMISSIYDDGMKIYKQGQDWAKEMEAFTKKTRELNRQALALSKGLEKEINDFEKQAKELGISTNNLPELNKAKSVLGPLDNVIKMTERFK